MHRLIEIIVSLVVQFHWAVEIIVVYLIWMYLLAPVLAQYSLWIKALTIFIVWLFVSSVLGSICGRFWGNILGRRYFRK